MILFSTQETSLVPPVHATLSEPETAANATVKWLEKAVIGLNLCPFAKAVHVKNLVRYAVSDAHDSESLLNDLIAELNHLQQQEASNCDTTLLIHPYALTDFLDFNDFLFIAEHAIDQLNLTGEIQIASFHPDFQFDGTQADDIENYTNRSPYPTLHLLRESSIERAVAAFPDASEIYEKNIETLQQIGLEGWQSLFEST